MYTCSICKTVQNSNTPSRKVVTKARKVEYHHPNETITLGIEPIAEAIACPSCPNPDPIFIGDPKIFNVPERVIKVRREVETPRREKNDH